MMKAVRQIISLWLRLIMNIRWALVEFRKLNGPKLHEIGLHHLNLLQLLLKLYLHDIGVNSLLMDHRSHCVYLIEIIHRIYWVWLVY